MKEIFCWLRAGVANPNWSLEKFAKNRDLLGHKITKSWENTPKTSKNS
jgi:hypothetical protein